MNGRSHGRRWTARFAVVGLVAGTLLGVAGTAPAGAGLCLAPTPPAADGRIRALPGGNLLGNTVYNLNGSGQTVLDGMAPGSPKGEYEITYRNASTKTRTISMDLFEITGQQGSFVVKFFKGDKDITARFVDGVGKSFKATPPGSTTAPIRLQIRMRSSAGEFDHLEVAVRANYGKTAHGCGDNVRAAVGSLT